MTDDTKTPHRSHDVALCTKCETGWMPDRVGDHCPSCQLAQLRTERDRLREALERMAKFGCGDKACIEHWVGNVARAALSVEAKTK